jgi:predicted nuclease with TOPRIM domain
MNMLKRLENIELLASQLKEKCDIVEGENNKLLKENAELREELSNKKLELLNLAETNKISKLAEGVTNNQDKTELKSQIDLLIKEIDSCLNLVKQ